MIRTRKEWEVYAKQHITGGYVPGGDKGSMYKAGLAMLAELTKSGIDLTGKRVLDIGCANGRLPMVIDGEGIAVASYNGFDVNKGCIEYAQKAFHDDPKFVFWHVDVSNQHYSPQQKRPLSQYSFGPNKYDVIVANSLFTHLGDKANVLHYLNECKRALVAGGVFYSTWFVSPPHPKASNDEAMSIYHIHDVFTWFNNIFGDTWNVHDGTKPTRQDQMKIVIKL